MEMRRRGVVATSVVPPLLGDLLQPCPHARKAEFQDHAPVGNGMVEVLPHVPCAVGVAGLPFLHDFGGKHPGVHFALPGPLRHHDDRAVAAVPDGDGGEPVERRNVDGLLQHLRRETFCLRDAPVLTGRPAGRDDFREPRVEGLLRKTGRFVRYVLAELAPEIRVLVRDDLHVGIPPRHVLIVALHSSFHLLSVPLADQR